jgi:hypothetical protein
MNHTHVYSRIEDNQTKHSLSLFIVSNTSSPSLQISPLIHQAYIYKPFSHPLRKSFVLTQPLSALHAWRTMTTQCISHLLTHPPHIGINMRWHGTTSFPFQTLFPFPLNSAKIHIPHFFTSSSLPLLPLPP